MTAGPAKKRTPMEMPVARHPHAMIFGCSAINNPGHETSAALVSSTGPGAASASGRGTNWRCRATGRQEHKGSTYPG
jgi:hypothetical protein